MSDSGGCHWFIHQRVYIGYLYIMILAVHASFDCNRPNMNCQNGGICTSGTENCTCPETHEGFDCGLRIDNKEEGTCTTDDPCVPQQGVCYTDLGVQKCYCGSEYYGDTCSETRLSVKCTEGHMVIGINPYNAAEFAGMAYIDGRASIEKCRAAEIDSLNVTNSRIPDTWSGLFIDLSHSDTDCGALIPTENPTGVRLEYTRSVVVQYDINFVTNLDERFRVTCYLYNDGLNISKLVPKIEAGELSMKTVEKEEEVTPIVLYVLVNGDVVDGNSVVFIGDDLVFYFNMAKEYTSMRIVSGEADNGEKVGYKKVSLIKDSCIQKRARSVLLEAPYRDLNDSHLMIMKLRAFQFADSLQVAFRFHIKVCIQANNDDCKPTDCPPGRENGFGRRRRSVAERATLVQKTIRVAAHPETKSTEDNDFFIKILVPLVAVTVVVVVVALIVVILAVRGQLTTKQELTRSRKQEVDNLTHKLEQQ